jgi:hypothetical protein
LSTNPFPHAQLEVEGAEGLVEQQHGRAVDERAGERDALLLAAGELARLALRLGREADALELLADAAADLGARDALALEPEGDVLLHREVGEERVALEDRVRRPLERRQPGDVDAVDEDAPLGRLLEAGDHPQRRRLAAAARAEQREELAAGDVEVERADRHHVAEALRDGLEAHARSGLHVLTLCAVATEAQVADDMNLAPAIRHLVQPPARDCDVRCLVRPPARR